ncbi:MAG: hypothetical protein R6U01_12390 [Halorubrum sp.]|uniref:DUF7573 domain-containing protein n=1 Tax=Halorubrum sp. TaxID=1879286 RepID=UPI0039706E17
MPEDRSLDEFAVPSAEEEGDATEDDGAGDAAEDAVADDGAGDVAGEATVDDGPDDADPAVPTATWTTDGVPCDRCGEPVARRWLDDGDLVCGACKEW